jgi:hypothetical protein
MIQSARLAGKQVFWSSVYDISWYNQATSPESRCFGDTRYLYAYRYGISWYNQHARWKAGVLGIRENYIIVQSARAATSDIIGQSARLAGKQVFWEYQVRVFWAYVYMYHRTGTIRPQPRRISLDNQHASQKSRCFIVQSASSHVGYHCTGTISTPRRKAGVLGIVYVVSCTISAQPRRISFYDQYASQESRGLGIRVRHTISWQPRRVYGTISTQPRRIVSCDGRLADIN